MSNRLEVKSVLAQSNTNGTVILGHAMFNTFDYYFKPKGKSLADYLSSNGYNVIAFHLTGYGSSPIAEKNTGFDQYVADYLNFIDGLDFESGGPFYYIGHSVGGLIGISAIGRANREFKKIVLVAPALWPFTDSGKAHLSFKQKIQLKIMALLTKPLGRFPMKVLGLGNSYAPHGHFSQMNRWAKLGRVVSVDNNKLYSDDWKKIKCPIVILSGTKDSSMAPPENIRWVKNQLSQQTLVREFDADHFGLIYGKAAATNVWPMVLEFIER